MELLVYIVTQGVQAAVDDLERADPLALARLDGVGRVDDHAVDVQLVALCRIQRVVLDLIIVDSQHVSQLFISINLILLTFLRSAHTVELLAGEGGFG